MASITYIEVRIEQEVGDTKRLVFNGTGFGTSTGVLLEPKDVRLMDMLLETVKRYNGPPRPVEYTSGVQVLQPTPLPIAADPWPSGHGDHCGCRHCFEKRNAGKLAPLNTSQVANVGQRLPLVLGAQAEQVSRAHLQAVPPPGGPSVHQNDPTGEGRF